MSIQIVAGAGGWVGWLELKRKTGGTPSFRQGGPPDVTFQFKIRHTFLGPTVLSTPTTLNSLKDSKM